MIASPLADLGSVILLMGILGFEVGLWYVIAVMIFAILGGILFDRIKMEKYLKKDFIKLTGIADLDTMNITWRERVRYARDQVEIAYNRMFWYIVVDVAIAAAIHNWIPTDLIHATLGSENKFAVALASLMGIPMYADVYGTLPIAEALFDQGVQIGTIIAFIMSVTAISIPALMMMKKVVKPQLLYAFVTFVVVGIIFIGYLFNYFYYPEIPSEIYPMYFGM